MNTDQCSVYWYRWHEDLGLCCPVINSFMLLWPLIQHLLFHSWWFSLLALHALSNGTGGRTVAITHCILLANFDAPTSTKMSSRLTLASPVRLSIHWLVSSRPAPLTWFGAASKLLPLSIPRSFCLFWFWVSSNQQQTVITLGELNNSLGM